MNRLARTVLGLVATKVAIVASWYLYEKAKENDWKCPKETESKKPEEKSEVSVSTKVETPVVTKSEVPVSTKVEVKEENILEPQVIKSTKVRKPRAKVQKLVEVPEVKTPVAKKVARKKATPKA
jgi:hypothetical protein